MYRKKRWCVTKLRLKGILHGWMKRNGNWPKTCLTSTRAWLITWNIYGAQVSQGLPLRTACVDYNTCFPESSGIYVPEAWRIYGAWQSREEPARAWPFNRQEACALAQTALDLVDFRMAFMVWIAFVVYLRPCEIVYRCFGDFAWADGGQALVIHLGYTKGGKRRNTQEQVVCRDPYALLLFALISEDRQPHELVYPEGMARSRRQFSTLLSSLGLDAYPFKPYSLRRGGATHAFMECKSYSAVMETGRWMGLRTAKIYINEAAALLAKRGLRESVRATIDRQAAKLVALMS